MPSEVTEGTHAHWNQQLDTDHRQTKPMHGFAHKQARAAIMPTGGRVHGCVKDAQYNPRLTAEVLLLNRLAKETVPEVAAVAPDGAADAGAPQPSLWVAAGTVGAAGVEPQPDSVADAGGGEAPQPESAAAGCAAGAPHASCASTGPTLGTSPHPPSPLLTTALSVPALFAQPSSTVSPPQATSASGAATACGVPQESRALQALKCMQGVRGRRLAQEGAPRERKEHRYTTGSSSLDCTSAPAVMIGTAVAVTAGSPPCSASWACMQPNKVNKNIL